MRGAIGVAKAVTGRDAVRYGTLERRRAACAVCPSRRGKKCGICRCYVALKTKVASETCPLDLW